MIHDIGGQVALSTRKRPLEDLYRFRDRYPARTVRIRGVDWEYVACGRGAQTLLLLPGAPGRAESTFRYILGLEDNYRIIAPTYPGQSSTLGETLLGLAGLMKAEGVGKACLIGGSYGGLIAQSFVRRFPDMVSNLVLSNTGAPRPGRAGQYARYLHVLEVLPLSAIRAMWRVGAYLFVREIAVDRAFWSAYFREMISTISKEECIGRGKVWVEFDRRSRFTPHDLDEWPGRVLILEAESDLVFPAQERAALRRLYPQATVVTFKEGGHAASVTRRGEYIAVMVRFLEMHAEP